MASNRRDYVHDHTFEKLILNSQGTSFYIQRQLWKVIHLENRFGLETIIPSPRLVKNILPSAGSHQNKTTRYYRELFIS
jgi:hypothetical protein